ncbi:MAG: hypothetical protein ABIZ04_12600 [Opitutus sp.]
MRTAFYPSGVSVRRHWTEAAALVASAWLVPMLVHLIPWAGPRPIGVALLPAFWTALLAAYFFGELWGVVLVIIVPLVNTVVTGLPEPARVFTMTLELSAYVIFAALLIRLLRNLPIGAPLAFVFAKAFVILVHWSLPVFHYTRQPLQHLRTTIQDCSWGLIVLFVLHLILWRFVTPRVYLSGGEKASTDR